MIPILRLSVATAALMIGLASGPAKAQPVSSEPATARAVQPPVRSWSADPRVQSRTYTFTNTGEILPYAVFVSTKVDKTRKAPLIVALRGAGGNPGVFMHDPAMKLAEEGGYIIVAPMGYNSMGNFGNPAMAMNGFGRRGQTTNAAPTAATNLSVRSPQSGRNGMAAGGGDQSKTSEYSEQDVMNVLALVRQEFNIDDHRIYLMGHSQGGAGALHIADKYSSIWAAVAGLAPGAPGFQLDANAKFKDVPILIMVGEKDSLIGSVQRLDERLKSLNIPHEYKEASGLDHGSIVMGAMPDVFKFFGTHTKP